MIQQQVYHLAGFVLTVDPFAYLVEVSKDTNDKSQNQKEDLPYWVLHSRHAIWLGPGKSSFYERALEGDKLKKQLLEVLHQ